MKKLKPKEPDNPNHKEDFNSLLRAVAKGPASKRKTSKPAKRGGKSLERFRVAGWPHPSMGAWLNAPLRPLLV